MNQIIAIAAGGAVGAVLRFASSHGIHALFGRGFPYGTLTVNVVGSLFIGLLYVLLISPRLQLDASWRAFLMVGLLGAFTTFSTFSLETVELLERTEILKAFANVLTNVIFCLSATWLGLWLGRSL